MPTCYRSQSATFSNYKHHNTAKVLTEIAPRGSVTFVSDIYTGQCNEKKLTSEYEILNCLGSGDLIMTDSGFDIGNNLPAGVKLNIPPF